MEKKKMGHVTRTSYNCEKELTLAVIDGKCLFYGV
jgi:hypothetical protein